MTGDQGFSPFSGLAPAGLDLGPGPSRSSAPTATFTLTAAGLRSVETPTADLPQDLRNLIADAISKGITVGLQQKSQAQSFHPSMHTQVSGDMLHCMTLILRICPGTV